MVLELMQPSRYITQHHYIALSTHRRVFPYLVRTYFVRYYLFHLVEGVFAL